MIKVNTSHIGDEPLFFDGTETRDILDLNAAPEAPEMTAVSDITYQLYASKTGQDLLVNGSATFDLETTCARCMKNIVIPVTASKMCLFHENVPEQEVDLTDEVREELLLALPDYIYCAEDCQGLCPKCGANLNDGDCGCADNGDEPPVAPEDSPWSVLDQLKTDK